MERELESVQVLVLEAQVLVGTGNAVPEQVVLALERELVEPFEAERSLLD